MQRCAGPFSLGHQAGSNVNGAALGKAAPQGLATPLGDEDGEDKTDFSRREDGLSHKETMTIYPVCFPLRKVCPSAPGSGEWGIPYLEANSHRPGAVHRNRQRR